MNWLTTTRKLILGETWRLPIAVAVLLISALFLRAIAPGFWESAGGPLLLLGTIATLVGTVLSVLGRLGQRLADVRMLELAVEMPGLVLLDLLQIDPRDGQVDDERRGSSPGRARSSRSCRARGRRRPRLRQAVADRGAERAGQDVGDPEGQHRVRARSGSGRRRPTAISAAKISTEIAVAEAETARRRGRPPRCPART